MRVFSLVTINNEIIETGCDSMAKDSAGKGRKLTRRKCSKLKKIQVLTKHRGVVKDMPVSLNEG
jgi:hypothetical protein